MAFGGVLDVYKRQEEDQQTVKSAYTLLDKESLSEKEAGRLRRKVPAIETQAVYELKKITKDERETLNGLFGLPMLIISAFSGESGASEEIDVYKRQTLITPPTPIMGA